MRPAPGFVLTAVFVLFSVQATPAADFSWVGSSLPVFTNAANWGGIGVPPNDGTADLKFPTTVYTTPIVNQVWELSSIEFSSVIPYNLTGSPLGLRGSISNVSPAPHTIQAGVTMLESASWLTSVSLLLFTGFVDASGQTLDLMGDGIFDLAGPIVGGNIRMKGTGSLVLHGFNVCDLNVDSGTLVIATDQPMTPGFLQFAHNTAFSCGGTRTIDHGIFPSGTVSYEGSGDLTLQRGILGGGGLVVDTSGSLTLGGGSAYGGFVSLREGQLILDTSGPSGALLSGSIAVGNAVGADLSELIVRDPGLLGATASVSIEFDGRVTATAHQNLGSLHLAGGVFEAPSFDLVDGSPLDAISVGLSTIEADFIPAADRTVLVQEGAADPDLLWIGDWSGPGNVNKSGAGHLRLEGPVTQAQGAYRVLEGTLSLARTDPSPQLSHLFVLDDALARVDAPNQLGATCLLEVDGDVDLQGYDEIIGEFVLDGGTVQGSGSLTIDSSTPSLLFGGTVSVPLHFNYHNARLDGDATLSELNGWVILVGQDLASDLTVTTINVGHTVAVRDGSRLRAAEVNGRLRNEGAVEIGVDDDPNRHLAVEEYSQSNFGTLSIGLHGTPASGDFGRLTVEELAELGGTLAVSLGPGFNPSALQPGDEYEIVTMQDVLGTFDQLTLPSLPNNLFFYLDYQSSSVVLGVDAAPGRTLPLTFNIEGADVSQVAQPLQTRGVDVLVQGSDLPLCEVTLENVSAVSAKTGRAPIVDVFVHIYESATGTLLASSQPVPFSGNDQTVSMPVSTVLQSGEQYRVAVHLDGLGSALGELVTFEPESGFPYTEFTGTLDVTGSYVGSSASFPTTPSDDMPVMTLRSGTCAATSVPSVAISETTLRAAPNPFNPRTTLTYDIAQAGPVSLTLFDLKGRRITELDRGRRQPGSYQVIWNGQNGAGRSVASGVYIARLVAGDAVVHRRLVLAR